METIAAVELMLEQFMHQSCSNSFHLMIISCYAKVSNSYYVYHGPVRRMEASGHAAPHTSVRILHTPRGTTNLLLHCSITNQHLTFGRENAASQFISERTISKEASDRANACQNSILYSSFPSPGNFHPSLPIRAPLASAQPYTYRRALYHK
jgi:hypothetical protein